MAKFFLMGNFTEKAFAGFLKDPGSDRSEVARKCSESVGAEMKSYTYLRGCLLYTSPSPRDVRSSRMPSSA